MNHRAIRAGVSCPYRCRKEGNGLENFDILVIGAGPGGYSLSIAAAKKGLKTAIFEKEHIGGTCLNIGCIPTKYPVDKANTMEKVRALVSREIFSEAGRFSFKKIQQGKAGVTEKLVGGVKYLLKSAGVHVIEGEAVLSKANVVMCGGKEYCGKHIVIATGSVPMILPIPGKEYCIDSTGVLNLTKLPKKMVVIGGGVIGLEIASAFASFGTEITIIEMMPELLPKEQPEAVRILIRELQKQGIVLLTGTKILRVENQGDGLTAVCEKDGKEKCIDADQVLMAAGRRTNLTGIDCDALGIRLDTKRCIEVDEHQRTSLKGVYAIGDVAGGYQLAHAAYAEAETALSDILGEGRTHKEIPVPACIYTIPCLASVGLTAQAAKAAGYEPVIGTFSYDANGMALAEGASGAVFVIMDKTTQKTLGITIIGENSSEMIAFCSDCVMNRTTADQWEALIVAHPSLCEMVREAALAAFGKSVHKN